MCNWRERGAGEASTSPRCQPSGPAPRPTSAGGAPPRPPARRLPSAKNRSAEGVRTRLRVEDPATLGRSRDVPELDEHFRGDLAWAVPAKLEYYEGTRLPVRGWFQSCEDCGRLTGRSRVDGRGHEYFHCRECELQERRRVKRDLLASGPIVIPESFKKSAVAETAGGPAARPARSEATAVAPAPAAAPDRACCADAQHAEDGQPTMRDLVRTGSAPPPVAPTAAQPLAPGAGAAPGELRQRGVAVSKARANLWLDAAGADAPGHSSAHSQPTPDDASRGSSRSSSQTSGWTESPDTVAPAMDPQSLMLSEIVENVELRAKGKRGLPAAPPAPARAARAGPLSKSQPATGVGAGGESWVPALSWELGCMFPFGSSDLGSSF